MELPINWKLLGNPLNWVVVWLMLFLAAAGFTAIYSAKQGM
jgi:hypothetical protein